MTTYFADYRWSNREPKGMSPIDDPTGKEHFRLFEVDGGVRLEQFDSDGKFLRLIYCPQDRRRVRGATNEISEDHRHKIRRADDGTVRGYEEYIWPDDRYSEAEYPLANIWVASVPGLTVEVLPSTTSEHSFATIYGWMALLAALILCGGIYGIVRTVRGRLQTAHLQRDFVSAVSHELRTPLTSIRLFSEMLLDKRERSAEQKLSFAETIHRECRRLEHLVQNILAYAQSEKGGLVYKFEDVDLGTIVRSVVQGFQPLADKDGIVMRTSLHDVPAVRADQSMVESMVFDLLDNAVRYAGFAGHRTVVSLSMTLARRV